MGYLAGYSMGRFVLYVLAGTLGAANMVIWGVYGDLLEERFKFTKVWRSLCLGLIYATLIFISNPQLPLFVAALCTITLERVTTEIYKALIRKESQKKYDIPSDFNLHIPQMYKKPEGYALILLLVGLFLLVNWHWYFSELWLAIAIGFIVAIGGMLKDAPYEGLEPLKFFRSPAVALLFGLLLLKVYPQLPAKYYLFAVAGGERIFSECYKKILKGRKPGKFSENLQENKTWKEKRQGILPIYFLDLLLIFLLIFVR